MLKTSGGKQLNSYLVIMVAASVGMFLSTLDSGIINIALPTFKTYFHAPITSISWAITGYMLAIFSTIVFFGQLSDRIGMLRIMFIGYVVFFLTSIFCALSWSLSSLILARVLQGLGASMMQANAIAIITTLSSESKRGKAIGTLGTVMGMGPILGPAVGGFILSFASWRFLFWINVPLCLIGLYAVAKLHATGEEAPSHFDSLGILLSAICLCSIIYAIMQIPTEGLTGYLQIPLLIVFVVSLIVFLWHEMRTNKPLLDLKLFNSLSFSTTALATLTYGLATSIAFMIPPFYFENIRHFSTWQVGLVALFAPLGVVIMARISGKHIHDQSALKLMLGGFCIIAISLVSLSFIQSNWPVLAITALLLLYGIGGGTFQPASIFFIMNAVPKQKQATIGAINRMIQNLGIALGATISAVYLSSKYHSHIEGIQTTWIWGFWLTLFVIVLFFIQKRVKK